MYGDNYYDKEKKVGRDAEFRTIDELAIRNMIDLYKSPIFETLSDTDKANLVTVLRGYLRGSILSALNEGKLTQYAKEDINDYLSQ